MLVYLDTAHLDWLEKVLLTSTVDARRFFGRWKDSGYELAVSYHHVEECAQLASDASIKRRLAVFFEFPHLWYAQPGSGVVRAREIETQLLHLSGDAPTADYARVRSILFQRVKPEAIQRDIFGALAQLRKGRLIHEGAATLDNLVRPLTDKLRTSGITPRRLKRTKCTPEMAEQWVSNARRLDFLPPALRIFDADAVMRAATEGVSMREAAVRFYRLTDVGADVIRVVPDSDMGELSVFFWMARQVAKEMEQARGRDAGHFSALVPKVNPYECPGFRLRLALLRARASAPKITEPSDMVDADHLVYAAHTDLAFVDKRTLNFLRQEARRADVFLPETAIRHIHKSSLLDDLFQS